MYTSHTFNSSSRGLILCGAILPGLALFLFLMWTGLSHAGDIVPDRYLDDVLEAAVMSQGVYAEFHLKEGESVRGGWKVMEHGSTRSGLNWTVYERATAGGKIERTLAFGGTELKSQNGSLDIRDGYADVAQAVGVTIPPAQYQDALKVAQKHISDADHDPNLSICLTGHSLGGGLAQYVSLQTGVRAFVFNSAPLGVSTRWSMSKEIAGQKRDLAQSNILNVRVQGDAVSALPGAQVGRRIVLCPEQGISRANQGALHSMETLIGVLSDLRGEGGSYHGLVKPEPAGPVPSPWYVVPRSTAEHLAAVVGTMAGAVSELELLRKHNATIDALAQNKFLREAFAPARSGFENSLDYADKLYGFAQAIEEDMDRFRGKKYVFLQSHTLEQFGQVGLDIMLPKFFEVLKNHNVLKQTEYPTFGAVDFVVAVTRHAGSGSVDIDTWTHYLDWGNSLAWGVLGLVSSGGNAKVASIYQNFGSTLASVMRDVSQDLFNRGFARSRNQPETLAAMWRTQQESSIRRGGRVQSIEQFLGDDVIKLSGFSPSDLEELKREYRAFENRQALGSSGGQNILSSPGAPAGQANAPQPVSSVAVEGVGSELQPGGIMMDVQPEPGKAGDSLEGKKRAILKSRPSDDALTWEADSSLPLVPKR